MSDSATKRARTARRRLTTLSCIAFPGRLAGIASAPGSPVAVVAVGAVDRLELLEGAAGADRDTRQRRLRAVRGHLGLVAQALVEPLQQRAAAREHDAAVHDVRRQLGRRAV